MPGKRAARHAREQGRRGRLTGLQPLAIAATIVVTSLAVALFVGVRGFGTDDRQQSEDDRLSAAQVRPYLDGFDQAMDLAMLVGVAVLLLGCGLALVARAVSRDDEAARSSPV